MPVLLHGQMKSAVSRQFEPFFFVNKTCPTRTLWTHGDQRKLWIMQSWFIYVDKEQLHGTFNIFQGGQEQDAERK